MTLDEAIERAEEVVDFCEYEAIKYDMNDPYESYVACQEECAEEHRQLAEWLKDYKRLLEQESVFDKIRAEIEQITNTMGVSYNQYVSKIDALQIIDKYKAESGVEE